MKQTTPKIETTDKILPFRIEEDTDNIYILDYTIPKLNNKENFKMREQIIWSIYGKWQALHNKKTFGFTHRHTPLLRPKVIY